MDMPQHHMPHGMQSPGPGAITSNHLNSISSRDSYAIDARGGHVPQQRVGQYPPPPSRGDYRQPDLRAPSPPKTYSLSLRFGSSPSSPFLCSSPTPTLADVYVT